MSELTELYQLIARCPDCDLARTRTQTVPGEGPENAEIMFIGEAPGFHEDRTGRPFVGAAGKFLDQLLGLAGLRRDQVYIANVIKCRPPDNRDPLPGEIQACSKWIDRQIQLINPKVIVTLGRHSMNKFFPNASITRIHGQPRWQGGRLIVPMFHPAAALHQQRYRALIEEDFKKLPDVLKQAKEREAEPAADPGPQAPQAAPEPRPQQMRLF